MQNEQPQRKSPKARLDKPVKMFIFTQQTTQTMKNKTSEFREREKQRLKTYYQAQKNKVVKIPLRIPKKRYQQIAKKAETAGIPISHYILRTSEAYEKKNFLCNNEVIDQKIKKIYYVISNLSNNLNQLARRSNIAHFIIKKYKIHNQLKHLVDFIQEFTSKPETWLQKQKENLPSKDNEC